MNASAIRPEVTPIKTEEILVSVAEIFVRNDPESVRFLMRNFRCMDFILACNARLSVISTLFFIRSQGHLQSAMKYMIV